jgi:hypothetical protein
MCILRTENKDTSKHNLNYYTKVGFFFLINFGIIWKKSFFGLFYRYIHKKELANGFVY